MSCKIISYNNNLKEYVFNNKMIFKLVRYKFRCIFIVISFGK